MAEQIKVGVDTGDSLKQLQDMAQAVNEFTQEVAKASGKQVRLLDASKDVAEIKELLKSWREVINAAPTLRGAITLANKAAGRPETDRPVTPMQLDQALRQNQQWNHATMVRLMTHNASHAGTPASTSLSYLDYTGQFRNTPPAKNDARFSKIASSAAQGLGSGGVVGGAAASFARGAERASDAGMGVMGILKGGGVAALAYGAYKAVSAGVGAVSDKMDAGKQENIEVDKFRRALGATNESFEQLRNQSRAVGEQFNLTYEQSRKLTVEFANIAKVNSPGLVGMGIGLAQATGADESQGIGFMATMRRSGSIGEKTADARLLSIQFAEALKRTGSVLNSGELMGAMGNFATTTAQRSLTAPNMEGYAGMLSAMVGSGLPGLKGDVGNAAAILNHADASFQGGGSMGEASKTLQYMALDGNKVGLLGVKMRQAAGMFATEKDTFGNEKSAVNQLLGKNNMTRFNGNESGIEQVLEKFSGRGTDMQTQIQALGNMYGLNPEQAASLILMHKEQKLNGMTSLMSQHSGLKDKFASMSGAGYMALADVQSAGTDTEKLSSLRSSFGERKGLTAEQKTSLSAMKGLEGQKLQDALVKFTTTLEREKTLGEQAQESAAKTSNATSRMASELVPLAQDANTFLSALVEKMAPTTEVGKKILADKEKSAFESTMVKRQLKIESGDVSVAERESDYASRIRIAKTGPDSKERVAAIEKERDAELGPMKGKGASDAIGFFMSKGWSRNQANGIAANFQRESNFNPNAKGDKVNGSFTATGAMQWHKDRADKFQQKYGFPLDGSPLHKQYEFFDDELRNGQEKEKGSRLLNAKTSAESASIVADAVRFNERMLPNERATRSALAEKYDAIQIPAGNPAHKAEIASRRQVFDMNMNPLTVNGNFTLSDSNGVQQASPIIKSNRVSKPMASGGVPMFSTGDR